MEEYVYTTNSNQSLLNSVTISNFANRNITYVKFAIRIAWSPIPVTYVSENGLDFQAKVQNKVSFYLRI